MKIQPASHDKKYFKWTARASGGLALGFRLHFPASIWDGPTGDDDDYGHVPTNTTYRSIYLSIGLLFWEFQCFFDYGHRPIVIAVAEAAEKGVGVVHGLSGNPSHPSRETV